MGSVTTENKINRKYKNCKSFLHGYIQYLKWANNNHAAVDIEEKHGGRYYWGFFPTVERCLIITNIPMAISLVEMQTLFSEKCLKGNNLPRLLIKASIWGITDFVVSTAITLSYKCLS